jgi:hypothetical protein
LRAVEVRGRISLPVKVTTLNLLGLAGCTAAVLAAFGAFPAAKEHLSARPGEPLAALPAGAAFAMTVDLDRVRQSELGTALAGGSRTAPSLQGVSSICGFDPTAQIRALAVAIPATRAAPTQTAELEFGIAATGSFDQNSLADCAAAVVTHRGGTPTRTQIGSFLSVRDRSGDSSGEIAVRDAGPVLVGAGSYLRDMIDTADGRLPSLATDELHLALRRTVGAHGMLVASWVLPPGWLERLLGSSMVDASPLAQLRAAAFRLDLAPEVQARAVLGCEKPASCHQVEEVLKRLLSVFEAELVPRPFRELARRVKVSSVERQVSIRLSLSQAEAQLLVDELWARVGSAQVPLPTGSATLAPNEVLRPRP